MRFEVYADARLCPVMLVILISNTAVKRHLTIQLEGKISLEFHANKQQY